MTASVGNPLGATQLSGQMPATTDAQKDPLITVLRPAIRILVFLALIGHVTTLEWSNRELSPSGRLIYVGLNVLALVGAAAGRRRNVWSVAFVYSMVFGIFHVSFLFVQLINPDSRFLSLAGSVLDVTGIDFALGLATLAMLTFSAATLLFRDDPRLLVAPQVEADLTRRSSSGITRDSIRADSVGAVGAGLVIAGVSGFLMLFALRGGISVLLSSYSQLVVLRRSLPLGWPVFAITLGISLLAATPGGRYRRPAIAMFVAFALLALPMGFRGEVLFPAATFAAIRARVYIPPKGRYLLLALPGLLLMTSFLAQARSAGIGQILTLQASPSVEAGLGELGSSIRPTLEILRAVRFEGQEYVGLTSVVDASENIINRVATFGRSQSQVSKVNEIIHDGRPRNAAGLGSSPLAEGFAAWGRFGVVAIFGVFGLLLGALERRGPSVASNAYLAATLAPMLIQVRNDISILPLHLLVGYGIVFFALHFSERRHEQRLGQTPEQAERPPSDASSVDVDESDIWPASSWS